MTNKDKEKALEAALGAIQKSYGKGAVMMLGEKEAERVPAIAPGCPSLERALGCGGYPRGRVVEIYGPEGSGKTTLTLHAIAECQRAGGIAAFVDAEHALDVRYAAALGVQVDKLVVSQPDAGEQALEIVETLVRSGAVDLVVVDSVAALVPQAEIEGVMGDELLGLEARLMSQALRKLTGITHRAGTCVMFINQLRHKIGVTFGSPETTTGGNALKFYASMRLDVRRIGQLKVGDVVEGHRARVKVVKNKLAPPFRLAEFDVRYGLGIDAVADLLDLAVEADIVQKNGAHYSFGGDAIGHGREKARARLLEDPALVTAIRARLFAPEATEEPGAKRGSKRASSEVDVEAETEAAA
jgi:recombination protein RecA